MNTIDTLRQEQQALSDRELMLQAQLQKTNEQASAEIKRIREQIIFLAGKVACLEEIEKEKNVKKD